MNPISAHNKEIRYYSKSKLFCKSFHIKSNLLLIFLTPVEKQRGFFWKTHQLSHTCQLTYLHWTWLSIQCKYRSPNLTVCHALRLCWEVCMFLKNRCKITVVPTPASAAPHRWAPQKIQDMEKERCLSLWHKCFDVWRWWTLFRKVWLRICHDNHDFYGFYLKWLKDSIMFKIDYMTSILT